MAWVGQVLAPTIRRVTGWSFKRTQQPSRPTEDSEWGWEARVWRFRIEWLVSRGGFGAYEMKSFSISTFKYVEELVKFPERL